MPTTLSKKRKNQLKGEAFGRDAASGRFNQEPKVPYRIQARSTNWMISSPVPGDLPTVITGFKVKVIGSEATVEESHFQSLRKDELVDAMTATAQAFAGLSQEEQDTYIALLNCARETGQVISLNVNGNHFVCAGNKPTKGTLGPWLQKAFASGLKSDSPLKFFHGKMPNLSVIEASVFSGDERVGHERVTKAQIVERRSGLLPPAAEMDPESLDEAIEALSKSQANDHRSPREKLMAYAAETIAETAGWEGSLLTAGQVSKYHGIQKGNLHRMRQANKVIAFPAGERNFKYPALQFVGQRITKGIDKVLPIVGSIGECWHWLLEPCTDLNEESPLSRLQRGKLEDVIAAAKAQYDL